MKNIKLDRIIELLEEFDFDKNNKQAINDFIKVIIKELSSIRDVQDCLLANLVNTLY